MRDKIKVQTVFAGAGKVDGWRLLDQVGPGDCDKQARCMSLAVDMLGVRPAEVKLVFASTNAGPGNCLGQDIRLCPVHKEFEVLKLIFPGGNINHFEGCCAVAGKFYAVTPIMKGSDDYDILKQLGALNVTQRWYIVLVSGTLIPCNQADASPPIP